jgi:peroxiredoxin family protein
MLTAKEISEKNKKKQKSKKQVNKRAFHRSVKNTLREKRESMSLTVASCAMETKICRMRYDSLELGIEPYITEVVAIMAFFECKDCSDLWPEIKGLGY